MPDEKEKEELERLLWKKDELLFKLFLLYIVVLFVATVVLIVLF